MTILSYGCFIFQSCFYSSDNVAFYELETHRIHKEGAVTFQIVTRTTYVSKKELISEHGPSRSNEKFQYFLIVYSLNDKDSINFTAFRLTGLLDKKLGLEEELNLLYDFNPSNDRIAILLRDLKVDSLIYKKVIIDSVAINKISAVNGLTFINSTYREEATYLIFINKERDSLFAFRFNKDNMDIETSDSYKISINMLPESGRKYIDRISYCGNNYRFVLSKNTLRLVYQDKAYSHYSSPFIDKVFVCEPNGCVIYKVDTEKSDKN